MTNHRLVAPHRICGYLFRPNTNFHSKLFAFVVLRSENIINNIVQHPTLKTELFSCSHCASIFWFALRCKWLSCKYCNWSVSVCIYLFILMPQFSVDGCCLFFSLSPSPVRVFFFFFLLRVWIASLCIQCNWSVRA